MAVNVNTVYQRVLTIANKEQRGYITPQEFNILANQAQMDIFEQYFYDINQFERLPGNSTEHSDMLHILEEKIAPFRINNQSLTSPTELITNSTFDTGITNWTDNTGANGTFTHIPPTSTNNYNGAMKLEQTANSTAVDVVSNNFTIVNNKKYIVQWNVSSTNLTTPGGSYTIEVIEQSTVTKQYIDNSPDVREYSFEFTAESTISNATIKIINNDTSNAGEHVTINNFSVKQIDDTTLGDGGTNTVYRLGNVHWKESSATYPTRVDEITSYEATLYNSSSLARPTAKNPAYVRSGATTITLYPTPTVNDTITHDYIKTPTDVSWGYVVTGGSSVYNSSTSTDFELHESEEVNLVNKILLLAGIVIKDNNLYQIASQEDIKDIQQEKA